MLDLKLIRKEPDKVKELLSRRDTSLAAKIDQIIAIDIEHRAALQEKQELETKRNQLSKEVGAKKSQGQAADTEMQELAQIKSKMQAISDKEPDLFNQQIAILEGIPNLPAEDLIVGKNEEANQEVGKWGELPSFDFTALEHDEIGRNLDIFDFERGVKIAKSRFTLVQKHGAKLERALINFFLDQAGQNGYRECVPPILVNSASLYGTGQLPKFAEDVFKVENEDLYLIPTAEVPLTNIYRDEILSEDDLPIYLCAYTPNFRSEAGSASKDTRGIIRQHQFNKIELVKLCKAEDSAEEHEKLTNNAESLLQALKLPYRKMLLCTGDMGFGASKCYDLEVWFPGQAKYREISSCSNFGDFQARRAQIRFRRDSKNLSEKLPDARLAKNGEAELTEPSMMTTHDKRNAAGGALRAGSKSKAELVHTINGSGLAVGRTVAAILENYQNQDGSVTVPMVLRPYLGNLEKIEV